MACYYHCAHSVKAQRRTAAREAHTFLNEHPGLKAALVAYTETDAEISRRKAGRKTVYSDFVAELKKSGHDKMAMEIKPYARRFGALVKEVERGHRKRAKAARRASRKAGQSRREEPAATSPAIHPADNREKRRNWIEKKALAIARRYDREAAGDLSKEDATVFEAIAMVHCKREDVLDEVMESAKALVTKPLLYGVDRAMAIARVGQSADGERG